MFIFPMTWNCCQTQLSLNCSPFIIQVLKKWNERRLLTVKDLMEEMIVWQKERYIDPGIWDRLLEKINPSLMPAPSILQQGFWPQLQYPVNKIICSYDTLNLGFLLESNQHIDISFKEICVWLGRWNLFVESINQKRNSGSGTLHYYTWC